MIMKSIEISDELFETVEALTKLLRNVETNEQTIWALIKVAQKAGSEQLATAEKEKVVSTPSPMYV